MLVLGAGAIGSFFGGMLAKKYDVTLIGREKHVNEISKNGLKVSGISNFFTYPKVFTKIPKLEKPELTLITVKSYDTEKIVREAKSFIKNSVILSMQNGLKNEEKIEKITGSPAIGGITSHGVTFVKPGEIYHAGVGETIIGELDGKVTSRIEEIQKMFQSVELDCLVSRNIIGQIWTKTIVNASINPITAINGVNNGEILKNPELFKMMKNACLEGIKVAEKANIKLPKCDILEKTKNVAKLTANNKSSMLQDIEKCKKTEIDEINGAIVETGIKYGVQTPINNQLIKIIKNLENKILI